MKSLETQDPRSSTVGSSSGPLASTAEVHPITATGSSAVDGTPSTGLAGHSDTGLATQDGSAVKEGSTPTQASAGGGGAGSLWRRQGMLLWSEWIKPLLIIALVMFSFRSAVADWNDVPTGSMKPTILEGDRIFINKVAYDLKFPFTRWRLAQWGDPEWGDVVVLRSPEDNKRLVKRVIGLPGDILEIRGMYLYRNGEPAHYLKRPENDFVGVDIRQGHTPFYFNEDVSGRQHPIMLTLSTDEVRKYRALDPLSSFGQPFVTPKNCRSVSGSDDLKRLRDVRARRDSWVCIVPDAHFFVMGDNRNNSRDSRYFGPVNRAEILGQATAVALSLDRNDYYKPRWHRFFTPLP